LCVVLLLIGGLGDVARCSTLVVPFEVGETLDGILYILHLLLLVFGCAESVSRITISLTLAFQGLRTSLHSFSGVPFLFDLLSFTLSSIFLLFHHKMHLRALLAGAALFASAYAKSVDSFAQGGSLPDENILFGPMKRQAKSPSRIMKRQSSVAPSTSTALPNPADPACTNAPDSRYA